MGKRTIIKLCMLLVLGSYILFSTTASYAATPFQTSIVHTKKVIVRQKGYLKVTSDREVSHTLFRDKRNNTKGVQHKFGKEVYFVVTRGVYYLSSDQLVDFTLRYQRYKTPAGYKKHTSKAAAKRLKNRKTELAISYETDKRYARYRYYKIIPNHDGKISYTGGELLDSANKRIPYLTCKLYPPAYGTDKETNKKSLATNWRGLDYSLSYGLYMTMEPLKATETYYLKVDLEQGNMDSIHSEKGKKKTKNCIVKVAWDYQPENHIMDAAK